MSNADCSAGFFVCRTAVALRQSPSAYNNASSSSQPPLEQRKNFLIAHGVSCMLQVVSSQSYRKVFISATNNYYCCICNYCLQQNNSTLARQTDGPRLTYQYDNLCRPVPSGAADAGTAGGSFDTIHTIICHIMPTHAHRTLRNTDHLIGFDEKPTEKPTEKPSVRFCRFKPTETDRRFGENRKTDRAAFHFRFTTLVGTSIWSQNYATEILHQVWSRQSSHALQSARIAPRPRPMCPAGVHVSEYFLRFCRKALVRREKLSKVRKFYKHTYSYMERKHRKQTKKTKNREQRKQNEKEEAGEEKKLPGLPVGEEPDTKNKGYTQGYRGRRDPCGTGRSRFARRRREKNGPP